MGSPPSSIWAIPSLQDLINPALPSVNDYGNRFFDTIPNSFPNCPTLHLPLNDHLLRWLVCYLKGRSTTFRYNSHLSSSHPVQAGFPQCSVISPALCNLSVSNYPPPPYCPPHHLLRWWLHCNSQFPQYSRLLHHPLKPLLWCCSKGLTVSMAKSSSSLFNPWHPPIPYRPSFHLGGVRPRIVPDPQNPWGHFLPPFHFHLSHTSSVWVSPQ